MAEVQQFLDGLDGRSRAVLERIRAVVVEEARDAEEGTSYGLPALKYRGKPLLGFRVAKTHLSVFPFSAEAVDAVRDQLIGFHLAKGTIRFSADRPPPEAVVRRLVAARMNEIDGG